jgi:hypothetical protein
MTDDGGVLLDAAATPPLPFKKKTKPAVPDTPKDRDDPLK